MTKTAKTLCCGREFDITSARSFPVYFNTGNCVVQCHACGHIYKPEKYSLWLKVQNWWVIKGKPGLARFMEETLGRVNCSTCAHKYLWLHEEPCKSCLPKRGLPHWRKADAWSAPLLPYQSAIFVEAPIVPVQRLCMHCADAEMPISYGGCAACFYHPSHPNFRPRV